MYITALWPKAVLLKMTKKPKPKLPPKVHLTREGRDEIAQELKLLKDAKLPKAIDRVARARDFGDLSENAEYHSAREDLSFIEGRIEEIEDLLHRSKLINGSQVKGKTKQVKLGSKVTVRANGKSHIFTVVGEWEADPTNKKISHQSPLGKALVGKKVKEKVKIEAPAGKIQYIITKIH